MIDADETPGHSPYDAPVSDGRLLQVNVSPGGVPKLPVPEARIGRLGVAGDRQHDVTEHGGPHRAVSLLGIEAIRRVAAEGHPIGPGTTGENLTTEGFDVSALPVGTRLEIGDEVVLELASPTTPCRTIRHSFRDLRFGRLSVDAHGTDSRMYARVVREGSVRAGDLIRVTPPADDAAERFVEAKRIDAAERSSSLALWRAAAAAGLPVEILDDGELAAAAAPAVPGPVFNQALGFAHLPHLVDRAVELYRRHGATGWVWADEPPWTDAVADTTAAYLAGALVAPAADGGGDGLVVRELAPAETGAWADLVARASDLPDATAEAFARLEPRLAHAAHHHRFIAELDGRPVAAASLHTHRGVGWLRSASVDPAYRGRGIQAALIAARVDAARRRGCELVGSCAEAGSTSARNLERAGLRTVAVRARYRIEPAA